MMPIATIALDHVNIRTRDLDASAQFYADVLGLRVGDPPAMVSRDQARWLFDTSDRPIIHLRRFEQAHGIDGPVDHVALRCSGKAEVIERLIARGVDYKAFDGADRTVIFTSDPHGVALELNFIGE
jgi:catechol 2,3-dioxygenase-like lactoylglutathione lyase family enzyme